MTLDMQSARSGGGGAPSWLRRMESNHRRLVYETSVNTNSLRRKSPGDLYTASRCDTVSTRDGNRTRVTELKVRRTYPYATPAYILSRKRPRKIFSCTLYEYWPQAKPIRNSQGLIPIQKMKKGDLTNEPSHAAPYWQTHGIIPSMSHFVKHFGEIFF